MKYSEELDSMQDWPPITKTINEIQAENMRKQVNIDLIVLLNIGAAMDSWREAREVYGNEKTDGRK